MLLLLPLVISPVLGLLTPYVALLIILPLWLLTLLRGQLFAAYAPSEARILLSVFVLFAAICAITADEPKDVLRAFNFTMFLAYGAIALFLEQPRVKSPAELVARLAAVGVICGLVEVVGVAMFGPISPTYRPQGVNLGPIVLSNALLALGFISLGGLLVRRDSFAWLYTLPPILAVVATLITGSRGPLLAIPFAALAAAIFIWFDRFRYSLRATLSAGAGLAVVLAGGTLAAFQGRAGSVLSILSQLGQGSPVMDESTRERLLLYRAGWQSFQQSPWIGHGWGNIISSVKSFVPDADQGLLKILPQLHNDVLNFAVAAGALGVCAYIAVVSVPIAGAILSPRDSLRTFRLYGATVLTIIYIGGGLTDLMFGFEFHTYLFAMLTAVLLHFCREQRPRAFPYLRVAD